VAKTNRQTGVHIEGLHELLRTMSKMSKEISEHARVGSTDLANRFLAMATAAASSPAETRAISAFKVYRDRVPKVGYSARASTGASGGARAGELFPGTEWGSGSLAQFPSRNRDGHFLYPTLRAQGEELALDWFDLVLGELTTDWNAGARRAA